MKDRITTKYNILEVLKRSADINHTLHQNAVDTIMNIGGERGVVTLLIKLLNDPNTDIDKYAIIAKELGNIGEKNSFTRDECVSTLIRLFKNFPFNNPNVDVRVNIIEALGKIGKFDPEIDETVIDSLIELLTDNFPAVRKAAAEALGNIGNEKAVEPLINLLNDLDVTMRISAARALGNIGKENPEAVKNAIFPLICLLEDSISCREAIIALGKIGAMKAVVCLVSKLFVKNRDVGRECMFALEKIIEKNPRTIELLILLLSDGNAIIRRGAVLILRETKDTNLVKNAIIPLINLLEDSDIDVRRTTTNALGKMDWNVIDRSIKTMAINALIKLFEKECLSEYNALKIYKKNKSIYNQHKRIRKAIECVLEKFGINAISLREKYILVIPKTMLCVKKDSTNKLLLK